MFWLPVEFFSMQFCLLRGRFGVFFQSGGHFSVMASKRHCCVICQPEGHELEHTIWLPRGHFCVFWPTRRAFALVLAPKRTSWCVLPTRREPFYFFWIPVEFFGMRFCLPRGYFSVFSNQEVTLALLLPRGIVVCFASQKGMHLSPQFGSQEDTFVCFGRLGGHLHSLWLPGRLNGVFCQPGGYLGAHFASRGGLWHMFVSQKGHCSAHFASQDGSLECFANQKDT